MKLITSVILIMILRASVLTQSGSINNVIGNGGTYLIKDISNNFLSLNQSTGDLLIHRNLNLLGKITKNGLTFMNGNSNRTFLGYFSGNSVMTGWGNTAVGWFTLNSIKNGNENSAFGDYSLSSNKSSSNNAAFGSGSLQSSDTSSVNNSAFGTLSLSSNLRGTDHSAFGFNSLKNFDYNRGNSAFGSNSHTGSGPWSTAFGAYSLFSNWNNYNVALGSYALYSNTTGRWNSAFGDYSLYYNITGNSNSACGYYALYNNVSGNRNCGIGAYALYNVTTGSNNIGIGHNSQVPNGTLNNQVRVGDTNITYAGTQLNWFISSDRRWKQDIVPVKLGLDFISELNPVSFNRINDENMKTEYGFIGQEVDSLLMKYDIENSGMITVTDRGFYELRYNDFLAPIVKAIQELKIRFDEVKTNNFTMAEEIKSLMTINEKVAYLMKTINEIQLLKNIEFKEIKSVQK